MIDAAQPGSAGPTFEARPSDNGLVGMVDAIADAGDRPRSDLLRRALLELPRLADADGVVERSAACTLVAALADEMPPLERWSGTSGDVHLDTLELRRLDAETANSILEEFHYLRSGRPGADHFGLVDQHGQPVVVFAVSDIDVDSLATVGADDPSTAVLSRVFGFRDAPRNSISYGLARLRRCLSSDGIERLLTYVNPNLGFRGESYVASGWSPVARELLPCYHYVSGRYRSARQLRRSGTHDVETSTMRLEPLEIFAIGVEVTGAVLPAATFLTDRRGAIDDERW